MSRFPLLLPEIGRRLRAARAAAGLTVLELARRSEVSPRYVHLAESGRANLSLLKLAALARALRLPLRELVDVDVTEAPPLRIALLGLRGAGKSTVGRLLAQELEVPFVELDTLVEEQAGMGLRDLFALHGEDHYLRLQREALEACLARHGACVLATGGSIVMDDVAFERLRSTCRTVWLKATAEEHWQRVREQGDLRPMKDRPRAFEELWALLAAREPRYAQAELTVVTSGRSAESVASGLEQWALA